MAGSKRKGGRKGRERDSGGQSLRASVRTKERRRGSEAGSDRERERERKRESETETDRERERERVREREREKERGREKRGGREGDAHVLKPAHATVLTRACSSAAVHRLRCLTGGARLFLLLLLCLNGAGALDGEGRGASERGGSERGGRDKEPGAGADLHVEDAGDASGLHLLHVLARLRVHTTPRSAGTVSTVMPSRSRARLAAAILKHCRVADRSRYCRKCYCIATSLCHSAICADGGVAQGSGYTIALLTDTRARALECSRAVVVDLNRCSCPGEAATAAKGRRRREASSRGSRLAAAAAASVRSPGSAQGPPQPTRGGSIRADGGNLEDGD